MRRWDLSPCTGVGNGAVEGGKGDPDRVGHAADDKCTARADRLHHPGRPRRSALPARHRPLLHRRAQRHGPQPAGVVIECRSSRAGWIGTVSMTVRSSQRGSARRDTTGTRRDERQRPHTHRSFRLGGSERFHTASRSCAQTTVLSTTCAT